jgi:hypothetical protein
VHQLYTIDAYVLVGCIYVQDCSICVVFKSVTVRFLKLLKAGLGCGQSSQPAGIDSRELRPTTGA